MAVPSANHRLWRIVRQPGLGGTVSPSITTSLGSFSPAAVKAGAVPALQSRAGLTCSSGVLMLLSGNYIRATYRSGNGLKLNPASGTTSAIPYILSADPAGTIVAGQNGTIDYMQNNLLNLLGLLGGSSADLPFFVRPSRSTPPAVGTYTDRITIRWNWYFCQGIGLLGLCLVGEDKGSAETVVDVTLMVTPKDMVVSTSIRTTWDPVNGVSSPKAIPGSKQRLSVSMINPDIVPIDNGMIVVVPISGRQPIALDGDGTAEASNVVTATIGKSTSLTYTGPASASDDVEFSSDGGSTWTYVPTPGDPTSQRGVTAIRFRPRGGLAAGGNFAVSFPVTTR
ncbi:spore coat protein U domain-containing protein [Sphingomonas sp. PL-96]|uniref:spore coat protein U domain-containing protein n=1 Tax=Sphingomonas sp. PL-96 TaxID=2887201 RepID=UPI001E4009EA|nr:spore coat protein U domain-containing protein [Sphingomonas sp. PL-96]MCC2978240.1 spore coat protein U domain-containing protein [Sphingomonas sp. PL-96]